MNLLEEGNGSAEFREQRIVRISSSKSDLIIDPERLKIGCDCIMSKYPYLEDDTLNADIAWFAK